MKYLVPLLSISLWLHTAQAGPCEAPSYYVEDQFIPENGCADGSAYAVKAEGCVLNFPESLFGTSREVAVCIRSEGSQVEVDSQWAGNVIFHGANFCSDGAYFVTDQFIRGNGCIDEAAYAVKGKACILDVPSSRVGTPKEVAICVYRASAGEIIDTEWVNSLD